MELTHNFTPGTRAVAQQVNQNFADVKSAIDVLETDVATVQSEVAELDFVKADGSVDFTRLQSYKSYTVSNATNATPIVITAVAHSFLTGDKVYISGVGGNTAANGTFTITKIGADTFSLDGSVGNGAFTSNGSAIIYPSSDKNLVNKTYADVIVEDNKSIIRLATCSTASATAEKAVTLSGFVLATGATIQVTFTNTNTADVPTLNVNSTGAKSIASESGIVTSATNPFYVRSGVTVEFTYNGTYWVYKNKIVTNYINGASGYKIWADGFIRQWGKVTVKGQQTVTLLISFKNTNYFINSTPTRNTTPSLYAPTVYGWYTTNFTITYDTSPESTGGFWEACGY